VPTSFIIDRNGNPAKKFVGARSIEQFEEMLMPFIGASGSSNTAPQAQAANLAPDFTVQNLLSGQNITLSQYKGKVVFVNFWATWCPPCRAEIPSFIRLQAELKDKLQIIGVSVDTIGAAAVKQFAMDMNINYPVGLGDYNLTQQYGGVSAIPTTVIVGPDGAIAGRIIGSKSYEEFKALILKYAK
jgi:thiol-disulfide isomerase/thioredoxin